MPPFPGEDLAFEICVVEELPVFRDPALLTSVSLLQSMSLEMLL